MMGIFVIRGPTGTVTYAVVVPGQERVNMCDEKAKVLRLVEFSRNFGQFQDVFLCRCCFFCSSLCVVTTCTMYTPTIQCQKSQEGDLF